MRGERNIEPTLEHFTQSDTRMSGCQWLIIAWLISQRGINISGNIYFYIQTLYIWQDEDENEDKCENYQL